MLKWRYEFAIYLNLKVSVLSVDFYKEEQDKLNQIFVFFLYQINNFLYDKNILKVNQTCY